MQYNPPYTLPWQRTNAIAIRVYEDQARDSAAVVEDFFRNGGESHEERDQVSSTISQSNGSR